MPDQGGPVPVLAPVPVHPRRLVYLGTPQMAVAPLEALVGAGWDVAGVVTRPDARRSRGLATSPSPVKAAAERLGLPVAHDLEGVHQLGADLGVVVAYGRIIRRPVLERLAMINLHFSLLPRWRGAAPVERALLAGDVETGVCVMGVEEELDSGPVYALERLPIAPRATAEELRHELVKVGTGLLVHTLEDGLSGPVAQQGEATYAAKLDPAELALVWTRPAVELDRLVRVGGAWTTFRGRRLKVLAAQPTPAGPEPGVLSGLEAGTGAGGLALVTVQPEGRAAMPARAWVNGVRPFEGERLGS